MPNGTFGLTGWYDEGTINASKREKAEEKADAAEEKANGKAE